MYSSAKGLNKYSIDVGQYPTTEQDLAALNKSSSYIAKWPWPYLGKAIQIDPWGASYPYKSPGEHGEYDLNSLGKDGQPVSIKESADVVSW